jgi:exonuclease VII small subunit
VSDEPEPEAIFELALKQLERILSSLECGQPERTMVLANEENGTRLLNLWHRLLDRAEQAVTL